MTPGEPIRIDIAVCTRDRLPYLRDTVAAVQAAAGGRTDVRFLIVDNGSRDGTGTYLAELAAQDPRVVHLQAPRPGVYHARAAAIRALRAEFLVFVDDDVLPSPDFLENFEAAFADPAVGAVGPAIDGLYEGALPPWFSSKFLDNIPVLPVRSAVETCVYPGYPPSACLALRRAPCLELFLAPQRHDAELGVGGGGIRHAAVYGEDTDLCEIYARAGFRIIRVAAVRVRHRVMVNKLTPQWMIAKFERDGRLRVRLARLRGKPAVCRETLPMLGALPIVAGVALVSRWLGAAPGVLARAYLAKSLGAWREVFDGPRHLRFPYPPAPPAPDPYADRQIRK